jgi:hypothetical protein
MSGLGDRWATPCNGGSFASLLLAAAAYGAASRWRCGRRQTVG